MREREEKGRGKRPPSIQNATAAQNAEERLASQAPLVAGTQHSTLQMRREQKSAALFIITDSFSPFVSRPGNQIEEQ